MRTECRIVNRRMDQNEAKMKEFYEPMLFMSTPEHPNTMGAVLVLGEPVDGGILRDVVESLRTRFPYFYVKVKAVPADNDLTLEANPLPMTVRNTWDPINLNSQGSNYHKSGYWLCKFSICRLRRRHARSPDRGLFRRQERLGSGGGRYGGRRGGGRHPWP